MANSIDIEISSAGFIQIKATNLDRLGLCRLVNMLGPLAEIHNTLRGKRDEEIRGRLIELRSEVGVADA